MEKPKKKASVRISGNGFLITVTSFDYYPTIENVVATKTCTACELGNGLFALEPQLLVEFHTLSPP